MLGHSPRDTCSSNPEDCWSQLAREKLVKKRRLIPEPLRGVKSRLVRIVEAAKVPPREFEGLVPTNRHVFSEQPPPLSGLRRTAVLGDGDGAHRFAAFNLRGEDGSAKRTGTGPLCGEKISMITSENPRSRRGTQKLDCIALT